MNATSLFTKSISSVLIAAMLALCLPVRTAQASIVGTDSVVRQYTNSADRERIRDFLKREDVQAQLVKEGVDPKEALARVDTMTDNEVKQVADRMNVLPAGGDVAGAVLGTALVVFIVLLITDILGLTHVFPFVYHRR